MNKVETQWFILYGICAANKPFEITTKKINSFLKPRKPPFETVKDYIQDGTLLQKLQENKLGQYRRIERSFREVVNLDLDKLSVASLQAIKGIGPKTARFIMLYTRGVDVVPLDTHVLKFLRAKGYQAPKSTPPAGALYDQLEKAFIGEAKKLGLSVSDLDQRVWSSYR